MQGQLQHSHGVNFPKGFKSAGVYCGIKKPDLLDLALIVSETEANVAGVFTRNQIQAAPVRWSMEIIKSQRAQAIVANSGNANCLTGEQGDEDARAMASAVAEKMRIDATRVVVASTGVIGVPLPMDHVHQGIKGAFKHLNGGDDRATAEAILTTDQTPKRVCLEMPLPTGVVRIGGIAKGSGMIAPNMATMLAFITTDAQIPVDAMQTCLSEVAERTFNCITVDGDTSTNDMVILMANGASGVMLDPALVRVFQEGLQAVCESLAKQIVRDGEGATKLINITVRDAKDFSSARQAAKVIAESLLVKTAIHGADPNWGRILAALGRSGVPFELPKVRLWMQRKLIFQNGAPTAVSETELAGLLGVDDIEITVSLGAGRLQATVWTCDLSDDYVTINSAYRT